MPQNFSGQKKYLIKFFLIQIIFINFLIYGAFLSSFNVFADEKGENIALDIESRLEKEVINWSCYIEHLKNDTPEGYFNLTYEKGSFTISPDKQAGQNQGSNSQFNNFNQDSVLIWHDLGIQHIFSHMDEYTFKFIKKNEQENTALLEVKNRNLDNISIQMIVDTSKKIINSAAVISNSQTLLEYKFYYTMNSDISLPHKIVLTESLNNQKNVYVNIFKNHKVLPKKKQTGPALTGENKFQKNAEKYLKRAIIYYENNTPPLAVKAMQQALESWPWIIKKADSNLISLVEERCKRVLLLNPAAAKAYFALGCISLYYNNSTEADKYFSTLKKIDPDSKLLELVTKFNSQPLNSAAPVNIDLNFMDLNSYSQKHTTDISANGPVKTGKGAIENTGIIKFKVAGSVQGRYYVKVCLESLDQKFSRTVEAMEGKFSFINIPPGIYRVYPLIGTKTINYDESVTVKDDFTAYESVEIEVLDHHISGLEILISE